MTQSFDTLYRAFEDKFRGSPDLIKERLRVYLPLLQQLPADVGGGRRAVDLGCGRGEWLEVVSEAGFEPVGVDLNAGMAQAALDRGFSVEIDDAIAFMRRQEAASASVVTAFHLAEHLPIETLLDLLNECHRVLGDGGLLILETPNPENISVGTWTFYIDPTHQKPLPPTLLEFLVQQAGFDRTAILRINGADVDETAGAMEQAFQTMFDTARDYACLAHKQSGEAQDILSPFVDAATQPNPANMDPLNNAVRKTEAEIRSLHDRNTEQIGAVMDELREAHRREMASRDEIVAAYRADLDRLHRDIETAAATHTQQVAALQADLAARETAIGAREAEIDALRASTSWRITAPLRGAVCATRAIRSWPRNMMRQLLERSLFWLRGRPAAANSVRRFLDMVPPLKRRLQAFSRARMIQAPPDQGDWSFDPDPDLLAEWYRILKANPKG